MNTHWNRFTGSHPINDGDPQNDNPDIDVEELQKYREDQRVEAAELYDKN